MQSKIPREAKSIPETDIHDRSLFWLSTCIPIKGEGIKLVCWPKPHL